MDLRDGAAWAGRPELERKPGRRDGNAGPASVYSLLRKRPAGDGIRGAEFRVPGLTPLARAASQPGDVHPRLLARLPKPTARSTCATRSKS